MAGRVSRGEIWIYRFGAPDKERPVLVISRDVLLRSLHTATVVAITSSLHGSPTEVEVGTEQGLKHISCANLANVFTVRQGDLHRYVGTVGRDKMREVCDALAIACGCA